MTAKKISPCNRNGPVTLLGVREFHHLHDHSDYRRARGAMYHKLLLFFCLFALASVPAFGGTVSFSGSGASGTVLGMQFTYNADGAVAEPDWGIPGVGFQSTPWTGSATATRFTITFTLPAGTAIDPAQITIGIGAGCFGGSGGGTTFCTTSNVPWTPVLTGTDTLAFLAPAGNDLAPGQNFFVNIFFSGPDPSGASFSGSFSTVSTVPEPAPLMLLGIGLLGLIGLTGVTRLKFSH